MDSTRESRLGWGAALGRGAGCVWSALREKGGSGRAARGKNRWWYGFKVASGTFFQHALRVLRALFLQVTGLLFLLMASVAVVPALRLYRGYKAGAQGPQKLVCTLAFLAIFAYFGLSSFWRARRH
jgi:hypothetical protein